MAELEVVDFGGSEMLSLKTNILTILLPAYLLFFESFIGVEVGLHSSREKTLVSLKVANIDLVLEELLPSLNFEVKPL